MILYKYMNETNFKDHWREYLQGKVYFSSWKGFNDPMEGFFFYIANDHNQSLEAWNISSQKELFTVCCMSLEASQMLMWSHYTNNHRGVCLEYEVDHDLLKENHILLKKIKYPNRIPTLSNNQSQLSQSQAQAQNFLTRKLFFWRYEKEYRLLLPGQLPGLHKIGSLRKVIFGTRFEFDDNNVPNLRTSIISGLRNCNVNISQAHFNFSTYIICDSPTKKYG